MKLKHKKIFVALGVLILLVIGSIAYDFISTRIFVPFNQKNVTWVSHDPDIVFTVEDYSIKGRLVHNGKTIPIEVLFDPGYEIDIVEDNGDNTITNILAGRCHYRKDSFTMHADLDDFFDEKYKMINFFKEDAESE